MARRWIRYSGIVCGTLIVIVLLAAGGIYAFTDYRFNHHYNVPLRPVTVLHDSVTVEHGHHLVVAVGKCVDCHGADLGGQVFVDDPLLGRVVASNLTAGAGGILARYTDASLEHAIRHGVRADGRPILIMPSEEYHAFSDEDVAAIIAYLHTVAPVDRLLPPSNIKLFTRALYTAGQFPLFAAERINETVVPPLRTPMTSSLEYGRYLTNTGWCTGCHGPGLSGGKIPGVPPDWKPASNLTPAGLGKWSEYDFVRALRKGVRPGGTPIDTIMPWELAGQMAAAVMGLVIEEMRKVMSWKAIIGIPDSSFRIPLLRRLYVAWSDVLSLDR